MIRWKGKNIVDLKRSFLDQNGASRYLDTAIIDERSLSMDSSVPLSSSGNFKEAFLTNLSKLGVASQKGIGQIFDSSVGASNVFASYGGKYQCTPQVGMISKIPKFNGVDTQTVAFSTYGSDPSLASQSTYLAGIYAVVESVIRNVILGGNPETIWLSLQEYFGKLGEDAKKRGACLAGLLGAYRAEYELKIPAIGGKDSMSGTFTTKEGARIDVPPTIVSFAANTGDIHHLVSAEFKKSGNDVYYMPLEKDTSGIPDREILRNNLRGLHELIRNDLILSSNIVEQGGVAATIAKMCFGNAIGFELTKSPEPLQHTFFQDILGGVVMEVDSRNSEKIKKHIRGAVRIGETIDERVVKRMGETISLEEAKTAWESPLENVFPTTSGGQIQDPIEVTPKATKTCHIVRIQRGLVTPPKVLVLVFPGTNSELDTRHALIKHGMQPVEVIFRNQNPKDLLESIEELIKQLKESSMVVFPGGFSAGDEPDGSAKFITAVCRMNVVQEALNNFFARSDTLALGICNGFQALIKLGVFDRGSIEQKLTRNSATLTFNAHRRHITDQVGVQVTSVLSPFLSTSKIGDRFVLPVSHGEGRLYMRDSALLETYIHNGQVVLQYLDYDGHPTSSYNGSMRGVAGLCSPDGRIFGLMPHPERTGKNLFQNVPGNHNFDIFGSAAKELGVKR